MNHGPIPRPGPSTGSSVPFILPTAWRRNNYLGADRLHRHALPSPRCLHTLRQHPCFECRDSSWHHEENPCSILRMPGAESPSQSSYHFVQIRERIRSLQAPALLHFRIKPQVQSHVPFRRDTGRVQDDEGGAPPFPLNGVRFCR